MNAFDAPANTEKTHLRGSLLFALGRLVALFINFLMQVITVRYLSKPDFGAFAFCLSVGGVLAVVSVFGTDKAVSRFLAVYIDQRQYGKFWGTLRIMLSTVVLIGSMFGAVFSIAWYTGYSPQGHDEQMRFLLVVAALFAFLNALDALFLALFPVIAKPSLVFYRRYLLTPVFKLSAALVVILCGGGVVAFALGQLVASFLGLSICLWFFRKVVQSNDALRESRREKVTVPKRRLYGFSGTVLLGDIAFLFRSAIVPVVLGVWFGDPEVASFQAVVPLARLNEFVLVAFSVLFLPRAAKLAASADAGSLHSLYDSTVAWIVLLTFPVFAITVIGADYLPGLLFGSKYDSSNTVLVWLACGYFVHATFGLSTRLLRVAGEVRTLLWADLLISLMAFCFVFGLSVQLGAVGGAIAVFTAFVIQASVHQLCVIKTLKIQTLRWHTVSPFIVAFGLAFFGLILVRTMQFGIFWIIVISVVCSLLMFLLFGRHLNLGEVLPELRRFPFIYSLLCGSSDEIPSQEKPQDQTETKS